jgi:antitoxin VapB
VIDENICRDLLNLLENRAEEIYTKNIYSRRCALKTAKLFQNGQSQAVRLPKEFRFDDDYVFIKKTGNVVMLIPARGSWESLFGSLDKFSDDYMAEKKQPEIQKREGF